MPSSFVQAVIEGLLQAFLEFACYGLGRFIIPIVSFGQWKCDPLTDTPRGKIAATGLYHRRGSQVYLTVEATQFAGLLLCGSLLVLATRLLIPVRPDGFWRGSYFDALCQCDHTGHFSAGRAFLHHDPWNDSLPSDVPKPTLSSTPCGRYREIGRGIFEWTYSRNGGENMTNLLQPGWLFCRITPTDNHQVWWTYREFNLARIFRIRRSMHLGSQQEVPADFAAPLHLEGR